jgi:hypothetical protein
VKEALRRHLVYQKQAQASGCMCYWMSLQRLTGLMRHRERTSKKQISSACFTYADSDQGVVGTDRHRIGGSKLAMMTGRAYMVPVLNRQRVIVCMFHTHPTLGSFLWGTGDCLQARRHDQNILQGPCDS